MSETHYSSSTEIIASIREAPVRQLIQARFADGRAFDGPVGATIEDFMKAAAPKSKGRIVAALVNGQLRELAQPLHTDVSLVPVTLASSDGVR